MPPIFGPKTLASKVMCSIPQLSVKRRAAIVLIDEFSNVGKRFSSQTPAQTV
jgi:hypothetical protein